MEDMLKARNLQDAGLFAPVSRVPTTAAPTLVYGTQANLNIPQNSIVMRK